MKCIPVVKVTTLLIQPTSTSHRYLAHSTIPRFPWITIPQGILGTGLAPQAGEASEDTDTALVTDRAGEASEDTVLVSATACLTVIRTPPTIIRDPEESSGSVTASAFASSR